MIKLIKQFFCRHDYYQNPECNEIECLKCGRIINYRTISQYLYEKLKEIVGDNG